MTVETVPLRADELSPINEKSAKTGQMRCYLGCAKPSPVGKRFAETKLAMMRRKNAP